MSDILRPHEGTSTYVDFNAAQARAEFAQKAGLPEAAARQQIKPGVSAEVAAAVVESQTGEVEDVQPVELEEENGKSFVPASEVVEEELVEQGLVGEGREVVLFDIKENKGVVTGGFAVTPEKYPDLPLAV